MEYLLDQLLRERGGTVVRVAEADLNKMIGQCGPSCPFELTIHPDGGKWLVGKEMKKAWKAKKIKEKKKEISKK